MTGAKITEFTATIRVRGTFEEEFNVPFAVGIREVRAKSFELHWNPAPDGWQTRNVKIDGLIVKNGQLTREPGMAWVWLSEENVPPEILRLVEECRPPQDPPRPGSDAVYVPLGSRSTP
ncbi:hypothetical protein AB0E08_07560 [Streptomyces sp. NPDC048281]|uniref:hypothetical protein n=1 Tax=Streptomyces sp. NPDC048281 TaxID=3154715 RepID=UPI0034437F96